MPLRLISRRFPRLKLYVAELKEYRRLEGGVLDLDEDDPAFDALKKIAAESPYLEIRKVNAEKTPEGRPTSTTIKPAGEFVCDVCNPPQTFESEADLAEHTGDLHTTRPQLSAEGEDTAATDRPAVRQGTVTSRGSKPKAHPNTGNRKK